METGMKVACRRFRRVHPLVVIMRIAVCQTDSFKYQIKTQIKPKSRLKLFTLRDSLSTKGASKARRDHINGEIRNMRALLPISAEEQERLSYLHSMAIICTFIRKTVLLAADGEKGDEGVLLPYEAVLNALPGFIVVMTKEGKFVYVSENVSQYLGFSMVEILQSDSFYELIDSDDVDSVKFSLEEDHSDNERSFVCRMNTSKAFRLQHGSCCPLLVRGCFREPQRHLFVALCSPTVDRLTDGERLSFSAHFQSVHRNDMSYTHADHSVVFYLGYNAEELIGRSWYSMLHPDDLSLCASTHTHLIQQSGDAESVFRVQTKTLLWIWIYVHASKDPHRGEIVCTNYIISETEAAYLRQKLYSSMSSSPVTPPLPQMPWGPGPLSSPKRQAGGSIQNAGRRRKIRRLSHSSSVSGSRDDGEVPTDRTFFSSSPYSPASSLSEDSGSDVPLDTYTHAEDVLSPPFSSSSSSLSFQHLQPQTFLQSSFAMETSPVPPSLFSYNEGQAEVHSNFPPEACEDSSNSVFHFEDLCLLPELMADAGAPEVSELSSPAELLTSDHALTDQSSLRYTEREQAEISILAHQISSLASSFDMYRTKSHVPKPTCCPSWSSVATPTAETLLDEDVIDSILKNWYVEPVKKDSGSGWGQIPRILPTDGSELLDALVVPSEPHSADHHPWPCVCRQDCQEGNTELHQLSFYPHSNFQQDGFADEESMY